MIGNQLVEAVPDVGVVLRGLVQPVELRIAVPRSAAAGDTRTVVLIVRIAHLELVVKRVVHPEQIGPDIDLLVIVGESANPVRLIQQRHDAVRLRHQWHVFCCNLTPQRVVGRDNVSRPWDRQSRYRVKAVAIANVNTTHGAGCGGVEDLALVDGPTEDVGPNLVGCVKQKTEVAGPLRRQRQKVHKPGVDRAAVVQPIGVEEEECFVPSIVDMRDHDRSTHCGAPVVLVQRQSVRREEFPGIQFCVGDVVVNLSVKLVSA